MHCRQCKKLKGKTRYCSLLCRIEANVFKIGGCWLWQGSKTNDGAGQMSINGKNIKPHRLSYNLFYRNLKSHQTLYQTCDDKLCCSPLHLTDKMPHWHEHYISPELVKDIKETCKRKILKNREIRKIFDINLYQFRKIRLGFYDES